MFSYIIDQYSTICKLSYHCFEIYHISALNKLLKGDYSARDFQMLSYIKHSNEFVTPASLKKTFNMNFSALSNRLAVLEKKEILTRTKLDPTSKFITLKLCQHGHEIVDIYDNYATLYLQSLKKSFKLKDTLILTSAIKKLNQIIHKKSNDDEINKIKGVSSKFLFDVYHYFSNYEIIWLSTVKEANLKQRDFFILSELFVFFYQGNYNLKLLSIHLEIPYQTLMSTIKKYKSEKIITIEHKSLTIRSDLQQLVDEYIQLRIIIYYETMQHFSSQEQKVILKMFEKLKDHAITHLN